MPAPVRSPGDTRQLIVEFLERAGRPMTWPEIARAVGITAGYRTQRRMLELGQIQQAGSDATGTQLYAASFQSVSQRGVVKRQTTQSQFRTSALVAQPRESTTSDANNPVTLPVLLQNIYECRACPCVTPSLVPRTVLFNWSSDLVLMAQAPSEVGVRVSGVHWLDESGGLRRPGGTYLNRYLETIGFSIDPLSELPRPYTTNVVQCWPGSKKSSKGGLRDRKPNSLEINNCEKWWIAEFRLLRPTAVLLLGQLAADSFAAGCCLSTAFESMLHREQGNTVTVGDFTCTYFTVPHPVAQYSGLLGGRDDYYDFAFAALRQVICDG